MSGKPKKNIAPKDEKPLENDVPVEEMYQLRQRKLRISVLV